MLSASFFSGELIRDDETFDGVPISAEPLLARIGRHIPAERCGICKRNKCWYIFEERKYESMLRRVIPVASNRQTGDTDDARRASLSDYQLSFFFRSIRRVPRGSCDRIPVLAKKSFSLLFR